MTEEIEKQAEKYANEHQHLLYNDCIVIDNDYGRQKQAFQDGAKWGIANAIEWHDLRKNPNDLPKEKTMYRVIYDNPMINQPAMWYLPNLKAWEYSGLPIIAWCELPQFKDKE